MDGIKTVMKRLLILSACSAGVLILLSYEFSHGRLSLRGLGIVLLIFAFGVGTAAVLITKKSGKGFTSPPGPSGTSIDAATRNQLLWRIRMAKVRIVIAAVVLVVGLIQIRDLPVLVLVVGLAVNLTITVNSALTVVRLRKILT